MKPIYFRSSCGKTEQNRQNRDQTSQNFFFATIVEFAAQLFAADHMSRCTDLVAGSAESGKKVFPLDFPPDNFVLGCSKCQKWTLREKINFPSTAEHFFGQ